MITKEQNDDKQLQRLRAQRQLYASAKNIFGFQMLVSGPVAVGIALFAAANPQFKSYAAVWGIAVSVGDLCWLTPWQRRLRDTAARVQEAFDCDVLQLPWIELKAGKRPDPELVKEQSEKYSRLEAKMPPLLDWYPRAVGGLPLHIGRIACQRANCWWDSVQRRRYAAVVISMVVVTFILVLVVALVNGLTVEDFILRVFTPLLPALILGGRQFSEQRDAAARLDRLKDHAERIWKDALSGASEAEVTASSRLLQDEILDNRRRSPFVFDALYKRLQPHHEQQMNYSADEYANEAHRRLKFPG